MYTLMIADDEIEARDNMIACVNWDRLGIKLVGAVEDGFSAYEMIKTQQPDLALLDVCMPGMDGLEVIRRTREETAAHTVFLIISGYDNFYYAQEALDLHVEKYLLKPFSIEEVEAAILGAIPSIPVLDTPSDGHDAIADFAARFVHDSGDADDKLLYPSKIETDILNCIVTGEYSGLEALVDEFLCVSRRDNPSSSGLFHCAMLLYSAICKLVIQRGFALSGNHFAGKDWSSADPDALCAMLRDALMGVCKEAKDELDSTGRSNLLIRTALNFIHHHYREKVSLNQIAEEIRISPVYLSNLFSKVVGKSITEYLQGLRIENAKKLLLNPRLSVSEVAEQVGYSDSKYFVQVFKRTTGETPAAFRSCSSMDGQ